MNYYDLLLRWIHIWFAIVLVGGTFFWRVAVLSALDMAPESSREPIQSSLRPRWSRWVMLASGVLLISGLINAVSIIKRNDFDGGTYHMLVAVKLLLALMIFWISARLVGRSSGAEKFRQRLRFWLNVNVALAVLLVCVAGVMKLSTRTPKIIDAQETSTELFDEAMRRG